MKPDNVSHSKFKVVTRAKQQKAKETPPLCCWHCNKTFPQLKEFQRHLGGFQLEFVSISPIINHMTCYKFHCSHWLKLEHSEWRANLVKNSFLQKKISTRGLVIYERPFKSGCLDF